MNEENDLAGQRELIAEYLEAEVLEPLKTLAKDITAERKKYLTEGAENYRQLKASLDALDRVSIAQAVMVEGRRCGSDGGGMGGVW